MLTETCLTAEIEESEIGVVGYKHVICNSHSRHTGGVLLYIKKGLRYQVINTSNSSNSIWFVKMYVWMNEEKWTLVVFYRSPSSSVSDFLTFFSFFMENEKNILIAGDFNVDLLTKDRNIERMLEILNDQGLSQIVNQPTRIADVSETLIDYIVTNRDLKSQININMNANDKKMDH